MPDVWAHVAFDVSGEGRCYRILLRRDVSCLLLKAAPKGRRRGADGLTEGTGEVAGVVEADADGYLGDAEVAAFEQAPGALHAAVENVLSGG